MCNLGLKHFTLLQNSSKFGVILVYLTNMLEFISVLSNSKLQRNGGSQVIYAPLTAKQQDIHKQAQGIKLKWMLSSCLKWLPNVPEFESSSCTQVFLWAVAPSALMEDQHFPPHLFVSCEGYKRELAYKIRHDYKDTLNQKSQYIIYFIFFSRSCVSQWLSPPQYLKNQHKKILYNEVPLLKGQSPFWGSCVQQSYCRVSTASCNRRHYDQRKLCLWYGGQLNGSSTKPLHLLAFLRKHRTTGSGDPSQKSPCPSCYYSRSICRGDRSDLATGGWKSSLLSTLSGF